MFSVPPAYTISPFGDDSYDSHRTNILGLGFPLFVSPHCYILRPFDFLYPKSLTDRFVTLVEYSMMSSKRPLSLALSLIDQYFITVSGFCGVRTK